MLLSFIVLSWLFSSVVSLAITKHEQQGIDYLSKMDKKLRRILEDHSDNFKQVIDKIVENSNGEIGSCTTKFKEPISIQVSNLPGLFSEEELKWFADALEAFIKENADELKDLAVRVVRQMEEKRRSDGEELEDLLILLDLYGCYNERFNKQEVQEKVTEKVQEKEDQVEIQEEMSELEKKKQVALDMVEEANRLKEEEEQNRIEEEKALEQKQLEEQKLLEEQQIEEQKLLEDYQDDYYDYNQHKTNSKSSKGSRSQRYSKSSKGKGKGGRSTATITTHYPLEEHMNYQAAYASSSFSNYNSAQDYVTMPPELRAKLQSTLSEQKMQFILLPMLRKSPDTYFRNITRIQYISGSFPKGFDETELQSYSEYIKYEADSSKNDENLSAPNTVVNQAIVGVSVMSLVLVAAAFFYVQKRNKRGNQEAYIENMKSLKNLNYESSSSSGGSSMASSSKNTMPAEYKSHPWKTFDDDTNVISPAWQERSVSSSNSKGTGLAISSKGTGLGSLSNIENNVNGNIDTDDEFADAEMDEVSECSSYAHEFRGECYAPAGKLGVVLDSMNNVVVVHRLKPGSPLDGVLKIMDRIVAIDDIDVSKMSATEVTKVMVSKMKNTRKITYIRGGNFGVDSRDLQELRNNASM